MSLPMTDDFNEQKESDGYSPIFLVELLGVGKYYASMEPEFTGKWLAGYGLIAGTELANADVPVYETVVKQLRADGIAGINFTYDPAGFARAGNTGVSLLNGDYLNHTLQELQLENSIVRIRMGFAGQTFADYVTVFRGVVSSTSATLESLHLDLLDDTIRLFTPVPPVAGTDFLPRLLTKIPIPIVLGDVANVPIYPMYADVNDFMAAPVTPASPYLTLNDPSLSWPPSGTVSLFDPVTTLFESIDYTEVSTTINQSQGATRLKLATTLTNSYGVYSTVNLIDNFPSYLVGFETVTFRRTTNEGDPFHNYYPHSRALDIIGGDSRKLQTVEAVADLVELKTIVGGKARGPNLFPNGRANPDTDPVDNGWILSGDSLLVYSAIAYPQSFLNLVNATEAYIDIPVEVGLEYRITVWITTVGSNPVYVKFGSPSALTLYANYPALDPNSPAFVELDVTFVATNATLRVSIGHGLFGNTFFDGFDLYETRTENPAVQVGYLIDDHMPLIKKNAESFEESQGLWNDSGDKCAGVIQQVEEDQAILGRIAAQFRAKTFLNERGEQQLVVFNQSRVPSYAVTSRDIAKGSFSLGKSQLNEIFTHYYVHFNRGPQDRTANIEDLGGATAFTGTVHCTPLETSHSTETGLFRLCEQAQQNFRVSTTYEVFGDFIADQITAENLLSYLVRRGTHQRYLPEFTGYLNLVHLEIGDFITLDHPLLPEGHRGTLYEILEKELHPNGCTVFFRCQEINPFLFGDFTEGWEPRLRRTRGGEFSPVDEPWGAGTAPTITDIDDQAIAVNTSTDALDFTVGDAETDVDDLIVTGESSNLTLVTVDNIVFGGSGASRTVTVTPETGETGTVTITLTVTDEDFLTDTTSFDVTVGEGFVPSVAVDNQGDAYLEFTS